VVIKVIVKDPRPDFRVIIDLLFGYEHNVDTEGDAFPVCSRHWRDLHIKNRESDEPRLELYSEVADPLIFKVESKSQRLEELAALYLYLYCGESIEMNGDALPNKTLEELELKYSIELSRAKRSIWHNSNEDNPYPNIANKSAAALCVSSSQHSVLRKK